MFPTYDPAQQVFNWHCHSNNIAEYNVTAVTVDMRELQMSA